MQIELQARSIMEGVVGRYRHRGMGQVAPSVDNGTGDTIIQH